MVRANGKQSQRVGNLRNGQLGTLHFYRVYATHYGRTEGARSGKHQPTHTPTLRAPRVNRRSTQASPRLVFDRCGPAHSRERRAQLSTFHRFHHLRSMRTLCCRLAAAALLATAQALASVPGAVPPRAAAPRMIVLPVFDPMVLKVCSLGVVGLCAQYLPPLELGQKADAAQIKEQFKEIAKIAHPDRLRDDPQALEEFQRLSARCKQIPQIE